MHDCDEVIGLREYRDPRKPWWLLLLLAFVVGVAALWAPTLWGGFRELSTAGKVVAVLWPVVIVAVLLLPALTRRGSRGVARGGLRSAGGPAAGSAARLCPHGVGLPHGGPAGRLLPWSDVADLRVFPDAKGRGGMVGARLRAHVEPTGLPPLARMIEDGSVPDDPSWRWLGAVRDSAEAERVTARSRGWRQTTPR
ncbi:hypothetical protein [Micromonospora fluostatini]